MAEEKEQHPKSREEIMAWYKEQIEMASLQTELAELHSRSVKAEAERLEALLFIQQVKTNQPKPDGAVDGGEEKPNSAGLKVVE